MKILFIPSSLEMVQLLLGAEPGGGRPSVLWRERTQPKGWRIRTGSSHRGVGALALVLEGQRCLLSRDRLLYVLACKEGLTGEKRPWEGGSFVERVGSFELRTPWGSQTYTMNRQEKGSSCLWVREFDEIFDKTGSTPNKMFLNDRALIRCAKARGLGKFIDETEPGMMEEKP